MTNIFAYLRLFRKLDGLRIVTLTTTPSNLAVDLIAGNYATHRHPTVRRWLMFSESSECFTSNVSSMVDACGNSFRA